MTLRRQDPSGNGFERLVIAMCDRFVSQRTFDLVVVPALADLEYEQEVGRRTRLASRAAVLRAIAGAAVDDLRRDAAGFFILTLLSASYYLLPILVLASTFRTWFEFLVAFFTMLLLSLTPVMVCFWPSRHPVRHGD
jgi:hypothetical protein